MLWISYDCTFTNYMYRKLRIICIVIISDHINKLYHSSSANLLWSYKCFIRHWWSIVYLFGSIATDLIINYIRKTYQLAHDSPLLVCCSIDNIFLPGGHIYQLLFCRCKKYMNTCWSHCIIKCQDIHHLIYSGHLHHK